MQAPRMSLACLQRRTRLLQLANRWYQKAGRVARRPIGYRYRASYQAISAHAYLNCSLSSAGMLPYVQVMMAIIRLQREASEVLITLNTPMHVSEHSAAAAVMQPGPKADHKGATALFRQALASFKIRDYGLFG